MTKIIKILLADDHQMFLESMTMLLQTIHNIDLVSTAANGKEVMKHLALYEIDVLICDLKMPLMNGVEVVLQVRSKFPNVKVLILTMSDEIENIKEVLQAGAAGYLLKTANKSELETAIITLANGGKYYSNNVIHNLTKTAEISETLSIKNESTALSNRELEILKLIVKENSSTAIAEKLFISFNTVETHRKHIYKKLGVNTSLGLLKYALKNGLVE